MTYKVIKKDLANTPKMHKKLPRTILHKRPTLCRTAFTVTNDIIKLDIDPEVKNQFSHI